MPPVVNPVGAKPTSFVLGNAQDSEEVRAMKIDKGNRG